jgi:hypothetical protein
VDQDDDGLGPMCCTRPGVNNNEEDSLANPKLGVDQDEEELIIANGGFEADRAPVRPRRSITMR